MTNPFAFDWDNPVPDEERDQLLEKMADQVVKRGLTLPAVWMLEIHQPVMPLMGQAAIVFSPFLGTLFAGGAFDLQKYTKLMQRRGNVSRLIALIERREEEARAGAAKTGAEG
jgi:hypothetical protein